MGNRRMFSIRIVGSTRFLKMPISSQNLYFHLGMRADDDGVVEAFPVMQMIGANEDDLRILVGKEFVTVLNEDWVTFINDWMEHNTIKSDRYKSSIYKNLLLEIKPDAKVKNTVCLQDGSKMSPSCLQDGSISKDKSSKDKLSKDIDYQQIADMYNNTCVSFPRLTKLSDKRKKAIKARLRNYTLEDFQKLFEMAEGSSFLKGQNNRNWSATFDWLIADGNMAKVLDGNYADKGQQEERYVPEEPEYYKYLKHTPSPDDPFQ